MRRACGSGISSGVTIAGPIGAKVSHDFPRCHCLSANCRSRALTSFRFVYPSTYSYARRAARASPGARSRRRAPLRSPPAGCRAGQVHGDGRVLHRRWVFRERDQATSARPSCSPPRGPCSSGRCKSACRVGHRREQADVGERARRQPARDRRAPAATSAREVAHEGERAQPVASRRTSRGGVPRIDGSESRRAPPAAPTRRRTGLEATWTIRRAAAQPRRGAAVVSRCFRSEADDGHDEPPESRPTRSRRRP